MKRSVLLYMALFFKVVTVNAQDTFSILAFDSLTHEIGAAGASCVDLFLSPGLSNDFICEIFPDTGAIASQASYIPINQANARQRMRLGDTPQQLMTWLNTNDINSTPAIRQYGAVRFVNNTLQTAAFTGTGCVSYKNHLVGRNYTIHGNILLGREVLDSMEARFLREPGDLACKLMAAMQGAKMIGADSRCALYNTSSLFAFLKVSRPTDAFGNPSLLVSLKTHSNAQIEPIDSLQVLFDALHNCQVNSAGIPANVIAKGDFQLFPNPALEKVIIYTGRANTEQIARIYDLYGRMLSSFKFKTSYSLMTLGYKKGVYFVEVAEGQDKRLKKLIID